MEFLRVSLMTPRRGQAHEATRLLSQIIAFCSQQPGFLGGLMTGGGQPSRGRVVGRVTLWATRRSADCAATHPRMLALRARLDALVEPDTRVEYALDAVTLSAEPGGDASISPVEAVAIAEGLVRDRHGVSR